MEAIQFPIPIVYAEGDEQESTPLPVYTHTLLSLSVGEGEHALQLLTDYCGEILCDAEVVREVGQNR